MDEYGVMVVLVTFFQVSTFCEKLKAKQNIRSSKLPPLPPILIGDDRTRRIIQEGNQHWGRH